MRPLSERFWDRVDRTGECWPWLGHIRRDGYGSFPVNSQMRYAHRVAYELVVGPIPAGLELDHLCRNRRCVRPDHLEPVTHLENMRRGVRATTRATHCIRGHVLDYTDSKGKRGCRTCRYAAVVRWRQRIAEHEVVTA